MGRRKLKTSEIDEFFSILSALNPEPKGELNYTNDYTLLVAVVLSAQATDIGVNKATHRLFKIVKTPEDMLALGEEGLKSHIKSVGLFNSKAKNVMKLSQILIDAYDSQVPADRDILQSLPGVGRKTANVVMNIAFGEETIAVDTHLLRLANRTGMVYGTTPLAIEKGLEKVIPSKWKRHAHHWLILHGRYICKARKPLCGECPVQSICLFKDKSIIIG